ncbi:hypothetical protein niasHT_034755 [Heterodera trifolii]|uniref:protein-serine/threonine phosphatase n=1 Tax=Heterodera trifolii TaxID=157864 RepID=A0ABD2I425_9BILA
MSLISVQRSPSPIDEPSAVNDSDCESEGQRTGSSGQKSRTLSECFFTVRGTAVILPHHSTNESSASLAVRCCSNRTNAEGGEDSIQAHLRVMLNALRPEDSLTMVVRLQSPSLVSPSSPHVRYLAVLSTQFDATESREAALLGFHFIGPSTSTAPRSAIGIAVPISTSSTICLDGDGGIKIEEDKQPNSFKLLFKPVSIQSMWSLYQCLHKERNVVSEHCKSSHFSAHRWLDYYKGQVIDDDSLCGLWHFVEDGGDLSADCGGELRAATRPVSLVDTLSKDTAQLETEQRIKTALKQIMQSVDLDDVTSQDIRRRLGEQITVDQRRYKEFIDHQMLVILGQLDRPSKILDYLYLGTEWNASNWEELKANGVQYILNVTKEVDNFFPTQFTYLKIWVSDEATTELLMHWQRTYDFIKEAKEKGAKVLVHCKKGISRSASTVIAYAMKAYGWGLDEALEYVKRKRDCITPNPGFMEQLGTFHGMLQASNNRHSAVFNLSRGGSLRQSESDGDKNETTTTPNLPSPPVLVTVTASTKTICPLMEPTQLTRTTAKSGRKCGTDAKHHQGTRRSSFPSSDYGFAHSRLCWNSGRVRQRRECFEQQFRRQTNKTNTTKQFVSNIAKKIGHLSLYGRFGGEIKSLRRDGLTTAAAGGATADATATTANATAAAVMSTNVRSLVIAFEQRK